MKSGIECNMEQLQKRKNLQTSDIRSSWCFCL